MGPPWSFGVWRNVLRVWAGQLLSRFDLYKPDVGRTIMQKESSRLDTYGLECRRLDVCGPESRFADCFEFGPKTSNDSGSVGAMMSIDPDSKLPRPDSRAS